VRKDRPHQIVAAALRARKQYSATPLNMPICPYVLSESMGFDLRFINIEPSLEGMYIASDNLILISSNRPEGRKRFTCAHEIGHHVLGHETVIDEIVESGPSKTAEREADLFAGFLLMPKSAVQNALVRYGVKSKHLSMQDAYILSKYFGVSYKAFIIHLCFTLKMIGHDHFQNLSEPNLARIRENLAQIPTNKQVIKVGKWWQDKAIDIEVGDIIVSEEKLGIDGPQILGSCKKKNYLLAASAPGIAKVEQEGGWSSFVKISRYKYAGLFQFKYEEEAE